MAVLLLWILFLMNVSFLSLLFYLVCSLQPSDHLIGKGWPLGTLVCFFSVFCFIFTCTVPGQVWYLIFTIPNLYPFLYYALNNIFSL